MRLYVLQSVKHLTQNYHSGGGAVIVASDLDEAKRLLAEAQAKDESTWNDEREMGPTGDEWSSAVVYETADVAPAVYLFPDKGCC